MSEDQRHEFEASGSFPFGTFIFMTLIIVFVIGGWYYKDDVKGYLGPKPVETVLVEPKVDPYFECLSNEAMSFKVDTMKTNTESIKIAFRVVAQRWEMMDIHKDRDGFMKAVNEYLVERGQPEVGQFQMLYNRKFQDELNRIQYSRIEIAEAEKQLAIERAKTSIIKAKAEAEMLKLQYDREITEAAIKENHRIEMLRIKLKKERQALRDKK